MKTTVISKKTWHYRLLEWTNDNYKFRDKVAKDSCNYNRDVIFAILKVFIAAAGGLLMAVCVLTMIWAALAYLFLQGYMEFSEDFLEFGYIMAIFFAMAIVGTITTFACIKYVQASKLKQEYNRAAGIVEEPTKFRTLYRDYKNKICSRVEFE